ncbi:MAG: hypothetical protein ACE5OY_07130 [Candidatus Bathyarchaeia archaeon]
MEIKPAIVIGIAAIAVGAIALILVLFPIGVVGGLRSETLDVKVADYPTASEVVFLIELGAVDLDIQQIDDATSILHAEARYNVRQSRPMIKSAQVGDTLTITIKAKTRIPWFFPPTGRIINEYTLTLGKYDKTTSFNMDLGAFSGSMKLKRLPLKELDIDSGAGTLTLDFSEFTNLEKADVNLEVGAATVTILSLANTDFESFEMDLGAATATVDFSGDHSPGVAEAQIDSGAVTLDLILPKESGCRLTARVLGSLDFPSGWTFVGEVGEKKEYRSPNYDVTPFKLELDIDAGLATVNVKASEP